MMEYYKVLELEKKIKSIRENLMYLDYAKRVTPYDEPNQYGIMVVCDNECVVNLATEGIGVRCIINMLDEAFTQLLKDTQEEYKKELINIQTATQHD